MDLTSEHPDSFFMSLRPIFVLGQISGLLPLTGTTASTHTKLMFSWKSWQYFYVLLILVTTIFLDFIYTLENMADGIRLDNFGSTIFYTVCILNSIFFVEIARDLPQLCRQVKLVEFNIAEFGYPRAMNYHIKRFVGVFFTLSLFEHLILTYLNILGAIAKATKHNISFLEAFYSVRFPVVMKYTGYSSGLVIYIFLTNVVCTMNWNFLDFFLICMSIEISSKFAQINSSLGRFSSSQELNHEEFWIKFIIDYNKMSLLTKTINRKISKLVFMSFASNLYHLSLQLLRTLKLQGDRYAMTYFYFSTSYLLLRTMTVSVCGAKIKEESQAPKDVLFNIKNPCKAARRLLDQVLNDNIHISGNKFFIVDRRFIVAVAGTLFTYEVILLQLNSLRYQDTRQ